MPPPDFALIAGVVFAGAVLQSFTGFGFALIVAPIAALVAPELLPAPLIALTLLLTLSYTWSSRHMVNWRDFGFIMAGRLPLSIAAGLFVSWVDPNWLALLFGAFLLASVGVTWSHVALRPTPLVLALAGAFSGFFGTLTSVGAPPLAIAYQNQSGPVVRATLGANIVLGAVVSLAALDLARQVDWTTMPLRILVALPFALLGAAAGAWLSRHAAQAVFRKITLAVCATAALGLTTKALLQLAA